MTSSVITFNPRRCASRMKLRTSARVPYPVHIMVVGNVVAIVTERRRIERQQPKSVYAEVLQVVELLGQPLEVANTIAIAIKKALTCSS